MYTGLNSYMIKSHEPIKLPKCGGQEKEFVSTVGPMVVRYVKFSRNFKAHC